MKTKNMKASILLAGIGLIAVALLYLGIQLYTDVVPNYSVINTIKDNMLRPGEFYRGETTVCVNSVDDLGFVCKDVSINLYYGKLIVNIPYRALKDPEFIQALSDIGITVYTRDVDGVTDYRLTYWGEPIEEWSIVG